VEPDPDQWAFPFVADTPWVPTRSPGNFPDIEPSQEELTKQMITYSESMMVIIEKDKKPGIILINYLIEFAKELIESDY